MVTEKRGQSSVEAMMLITLMVIIMMSFFVVIAQRSVDNERELFKAGLEDVAQYVKAEVLLAYSAEGNYQRGFSLPLHVRGSDYAIKIYSAADLGEGINISEVVVSSTEPFEYYSVVPLPSVVDGDIARGYNMIRKSSGGEINILYECTDKDLDGDTYTDIMCDGGTDCDDDDGDVYPGNADICDGKDNDCNTITDEGCDDDNDDYCDISMTRASPYSCFGTTQCCPSGGNDCDDEESSAHPGAAEICGNAVDEDCDGYICAAEITASADDAYAAGGINAFNDENIITGLTGGNNFWGGLRFTNLNMLAGKTIDESHIKIYKGIIFLNGAAVDIFGEDADDAQDFSAGAAIDARALTGSSVPWATPGITNQWVETPNIAAPVQEVINRAGWANTLVVIMRPQSGAEQGLDYFTAWDRGGSPAQAAKLIVKYS